MPNRLLVVDDDPEVGALILEAGRAIGYEASQVTDASQMDEALSAGDPTLLALDLRMPGQDGIELLGDLGRRGLTSKVLLISGMDGRTIQAAERIAQSHGLRMLGTMAKPFNRQALRELMAKALQPAAAASEGEIAQAIAEGQLFLDYQPKINLRTGRVAGAEALARWRRKDHGVVPPSVFIPIIESGPLLKPFTAAVLRSACDQCRVWAEAGHQVVVAVNIGAASVSDPTMPDNFLEIVSAGGRQPTEVVLELTETGVMLDAQRSIEVLTRVRVKGFGLSMDDFGIGYSSIQQLHRMPFNEIKVDRAFVSEMTTRSEAAAIVRSVVDLGHNMGMHVCAEGVENKETHEALVALGCDLAQGYYYGKPMSASISPKAWLNH